MAKALAKLTAKEEGFSQDVAGGMPQTAAYRKRYSVNPKTKDTTVHELASRLAAKAKVRARIDELKAIVVAKATEDFAIDKVRILRELFALATADLRQAYNEDGSLKPPHDWPDDLAKAISSIEIIEASGQDGPVVAMTKKIRTYDKGKALDMAMKHLGQYEQDNKQRTDPLADLLGALTGRVIGPGGGE